MVADVVLPLKVDTFTAYPRIVAHLGDTFLFRRGLGVDCLLKKCKEWKRDTKVVLDATTENLEFSELCADLYNDLFVDPDEELARTKAIADLFGVNAGPGACGIFEIDNKTLWHQHYLGVLNIVDGVKKWTLRAPWVPKNGPQTIILQMSGDVLWIPPGWHHEVSTVTGSLQNHNRQRAASFASWCLPSAQSADALCHFLAGHVDEGQVRKGKRPADKELKAKLYKLRVE